MQKIQKFLKIYWLESLLAGLILSSHLYIALTPANSLLNWFHIDDSFYYFKTAANIAHGMGSTFDGLGRTNGYHPLWMIILIPVFWFTRFNLILPLRMVVIVQGLFNAATGIVLFRTARKALTLGIAAALAFAWTLLPVFFQVTMISGLETAASTFFIILTWYVLVVWLQTPLEQISAKQTALLGVSSGLTILARLDNVFLIFAVGIAVLIRLLILLPADRTVIKLRSHWLFRQVIAFALPVALFLGGYLLWNRVYIGHWMPISGEIKRWWAALGNTPYGRPARSWYDGFKKAFLDADGAWGLLYTWIWNLRMQFETWGWPQLARLRWVVGMLAAVVLLPLRANYKAYLKLAAGVLLAGFLLHSAYYQTVRYVGTRDWYWIGETLITVVWVSLVVDGWFRWLVPAGWQKGANFVLAALSILLIVNAHVTFVRHRYPMHRPADELPHYYLHRTQWLEENTPPGAKIGATGAGNLGYFIIDRTIVPLDGLIGNYDYFYSLQKGKAGVYLQDHGLDYVFGKSWLAAAAPYGGIFKDRLDLKTQYLYAEGYKEENLWHFTPVQK